MCERGAQEVRQMYRRLSDEGLSFSVYHSRLQRDTSVLLPDGRDSPNHVRIHPKGTMVRRLRAGLREGLQGRAQNPKGSGGYKGGVGSKVFTTGFR